MVNYSITGYESYKEYISEAISKRKIVALMENRFVPTVHID